MAVNLVVILEALWNFTNLVHYDEITVLHIFGGFSDIGYGTLRWVTSINIMTWIKQENDTL